MLLHSLQCTGQPPNKVLFNSNANSAEVRNPAPNSALLTLVSLQTRSQVRLSINITQLHPVSSSDMENVLSEHIKT